MNIARVNGLVERAAETLAELASELRQLSAGNPGGLLGGLGGYRGPSAPRRRDGGASTGGAEVGPGACGLREEGEAKPSGDPLGRLRAFWDGVTMAPVMTLGECRIDLATAGGRWELLALAVLLGARVSHRVVERTFATLRGEGLLDLYRLAAEGERARHLLEGVLHAHYHAMSNKQGKVDALIENARRLVEEWDGDLHAIYLAAKAAREGGSEVDGPGTGSSSAKPGADAAGGAPQSAVDEEMLIRWLQSFKHVKRLAFWICRTLKAHGIWRELGDWATGYQDRYTRLPLERLGSLDEALLSGTPSRVPGAHMALFMQGFNLCSQNDVKVCLTECPVAAWCTFPDTAGGSDAESHEESWGE